MTTELDLTAMRDIAKAATDGPWSVYDRGIGFEVYAGEGYVLNSGQRETFGKQDAAHIAAFDPPTVLALLDRVEAAELWTVAHPCQVSHEQPYDFKWCETHDRTFPLDGDCDHKGKSALDWQDAREQEQRVRALRAEARAESAESKVAAVEAAYKEKHYDAEGNHAVYAWAIRAALDGGA